MSLETTQLIADLLLPPGGFLILIAIGLFLWLFRLRKTAAICIIFGTALIYFASTPYVAHRLLDPLQYEYSVLDEIPANAQAIVVLAAGRLEIAREYDNLDTINSDSLERLRYAVKLAKASELPILLSGGSIYGERQSLAKLMQQVLERDYAIQATWLEEDSKTTLENAKYSKQILNDNSISEFLLVTHAYHMPRAMWSFKNVGLHPTAAPTIFYKNRRQVSANKDFIPSALALLGTKRALHEHIGRLWYRYFSN